MDLNEFISVNITNRTQSMFEFDIVQNELLMSNKIDDKSVLVIGGAGTIGSSFIRALLRFKPKSLVVVPKFIASYKKIQKRHFKKLMI